MTAKSLVLVVLLGNALALTESWADDGTTPGMRPETGQGTDRPRQYRPMSFRLPDSVGQRYFGSYVLPALAANGCLTCHTPARGDVHPAIRYESLLPYLAMGQSATNNILMMKMANQRSLSPQQPAHVGGQRCATEDDEPCRTLQAWWRIEFGQE